MSLHLAAPPSTKISVPLTKLEAFEGSAHETENIVRLGVPEDHSTKENAAEADYSSFHGTAGTGDRLLCCAGGSHAPVQDPHTHSRGISLLSVLKFPFRVLTPGWVIFPLVESQNLRPPPGSPELTAEVRQYRHAFGSETILFSQA